MTSSIGGMCLYTGLKTELARRKGGHRPGAASCGIVRTITV